MSSPDAAVLVALISAIGAIIVEIIRNRGKRT